MRNAEALQNDFKTMAKKAAKKAAKVAPETKKKVEVTAVKRLVEAGELYEAGDTFETTAKRAKALGALVTTPSGD